jgi:hypothetical protein
MTSVIVSDLRLPRMQDDIALAKLLQQQEYYFYQVSSQGGGG